MSGSSEGPSPALSASEYFPLRSGLSFHPRNGSNQVVLEDTSRTKFYRLGPAEAVFVESLTENGSMVEACSQANKVDSTFGADTASRLCKWLSLNQLTATKEPEGTTSPVNQLVIDASRANPLSLLFFWKISLINPDSLLKRFVRYFGWFFSPYCVLAGIVCFVLGVLQTSGRWAEFSSSYQNLFTSWRGIWLAITWLALKVVHETAHAATCRRYGGEVNDAGLAMILLMPIAYVNVTSSWRLRSRWNRLHVTLAGVALELFIAGVALVGWNLVESLPLKQAAADVVLLASISSILFNLNPLLKFDGYFALADITGVDNLYSFGQRYAHYFGIRYILGLDATAPLLPGSNPTWIKWYGVSASVYRGFTTIGLLVGAAALLKGAGVFIAIAGVFLFFVKPIASLIIYLWSLHRNSQLSITRLTARLGSITALTLVPLWFIPAHFTWTSPAIVQYDPPAILRTRVAAFVDKLYVHDGDSVTAGQVIAILRNDDLELELQGLQKELAQTEQQILAAQWEADSSKFGDAKSRKTGLVERVHEMQEQFDSLTVRSPITGRLIARNLHLTKGTYIKAGYELGIIGREDSKRIKLSLTQYHAKQVDHWMANSLRIVINGHPTMTSTLTRLDARASSNPPDESLMANFGGSLDAVTVSNSTIELIEPRVNAYIQLTPEQSRQVRNGQRAYVLVGATYQSLGDFLYSKLMSLAL